MKVEYIFAFLFVALVGMLGVVAWHEGTRSAEAKHCTEYYEGIPIPTNNNGIVCLHKEVVYSHKQ